jgi:hypothetical protein
MSVLFSMVWSYGGIPEVILFETENEAMVEWKKAHKELFSLDKERGHQYPSFEQTWKDGHMAGHKTEVWFRDSEIKGTIVNDRKYFNMVRGLCELVSPSSKFSLPTSCEDFVLDGYMSIVRRMNANKFPMLYPTQCVECGKGIEQGYSDGADNWCSERCLFTHGYTKEQYEEDHRNDRCWWTAWEDWKDCDIETLNQVLDGRVSQFEELWIGGYLE